MREGEKEMGVGNPAEGWPRIYNNCTLKISFERSLDSTS